MKTFDGLKRAGLVLALALLTFSGAVSAQAQTNLLTNGSFESPVLSPTNTWYQGVEGWQDLSNSGSVGTTYVQAGIPGFQNGDGTQECFFPWGDRNSNTYFHLAQTFGQAQANMTYTFTVDVFPLDYAKAAAVINIEPDDWSPAYTAAQWNPAWSIAQFAVSDGAWSRVIVSFNTAYAPAAVGKNIRVRIQGAQLAIDRAIVTATPNPTNLLKNGSFEQPALSAAPNNWANGAQDWQDLSNAGLGTTFVDPTIPGCPNTDGNQMVFGAVGDRTTDSFFFLAQNLASMDANTTYTLTVDLYPLDFAKATSQLYIETPDFKTIFAQASWNPKYSQADFALKANKWKRGATITFSSKDFADAVGKPFMVLISGAQTAVDNVVLTAVKGPNVPVELSSFAAE